MPRSLFAVLMLAFLTACGGESPAPGAVDDDPRPAVARSAAPIIGGNQTKDYPYVVALAVQGNETKRWFAYCTGTLIAPSTVLTAAHCVEPALYVKDSKGRWYNHGVIFHWVDDDRDLDDSNGIENDVYWNVGPGDTFVEPGLPRDAYRAVVKVVRMEFHPKWGETPSNIGDGGDVAVLELERPVTEVTPAPWNATPLTNAIVGLNVHHIGFGLDAKSSPDTGSGAGLKREANYPITALLARDIASRAQGDASSTCNGDSGGPAFVDLSGQNNPANEVVVAVVSRGPPLCDGHGLDTRTDVYADWLSATYGQWEGKSCEADGFCRLGCDDDGGNPVTDPDCLGTYGACVDDNDCTSRICNSDPQHEGKYCAPACTAKADCPSDMECSSGKCRYTQRPPVALGAACTTTDTCLDGGVCTGPEGGTPVCATDCTDSNSCPYPTQTCVAGADGRRYCSPEAKPLTFPVETAVLGKDVGGCSSTGVGSSGVCAALALVLVALARRPARSPYGR